MEAQSFTTNLLELFLALTTNGAGLVLLGLIFTYSLHTFSIFNARNKYLYFLFLISLIELCDHMITTVVQYFDFFNNVRLGTILYSMTFVINSIYLIAWICYLNDHMKKFVIVDQHYQRRLLMLSIPVNCLLFLSILNMFVPIFFRFDGIAYTRLPGYYLTLLIPVAYLVYGLILFARSKHRRRIYQQLPFVALLVPIVLAHIAESLFINLCCIPLANTFTLTLLVLTNVKHRSSVDAMTGLYSRQEFYHFMEVAVASKQKVVGVMLDLDHFKEINDTYGHLVGDDALVDFGHMLKTNIGANAAAYRYAGDEFIVLVTNSNEEHVTQMMERFDQQLARFNAESDNVYTLHASHGITSLTAEDDANTFLARMEHLMYQNKHGVPTERLNF